MMQLNDLTKSFGPLDVFRDLAPVFIPVNASSWLGPMAPESRPFCE